MEMTETFISAAEFSRLSGLSPATVSRYIASGRLSTVISPLGRRVIPVSELDRIAPDARKKISERENAISEMKFVPETASNQKELELLREQVEILKTGLERAQNQIDFLQKQNANLVAQLAISSESRSRLESALLSISTTTPHKTSQKRDAKGRFCSHQKNKGNQE